MNNWSPNSPKPSICQTSEATIPLSITWLILTDGCATAAAENRGKPHSHGEQVNWRQTSCPIDVTECPSPCRFLVNMVVMAYGINILWWIWKVNDDPNQTRVKMWREKWSTHWQSLCVSRNLMHQANVVMSAMSALCTRKSEGVNSTRSQKRICYSLQSWKKQLPMIDVHGTTQFTKSRLL